MSRSILCFILCCTATIASAQNFRSYSTSTQSKSVVNRTSSGLTVDLENQPLGDALHQIAQASDAGVWIEAAAISRMQMPVTLAGSKMSLADAATRMLTRAKLHALVDAKAGLIVTTEKVTLAEARDCKLISLAGMKVEDSLKKQVPLMMFHTPLEMGLQMVEGFGGVKVHVDHVSIRRAGIDLFQPVTLSGQPATLARSLDEMLHPRGLDWYVSDEGVVVTTKQSKIAAYKSVEA